MCDVQQFLAKEKNFKIPPIEYKDIGLNVFTPMMDIDVNVPTLVYMPLVKNEGFSPDVVCLSLAYLYL